MTNTGHRGKLRIGGHLDRYVTRLFAMSYLAAFFLVVGLFLIIDMALNLDEYLRANADGSSPSVLLILGFYGLQVPFLYLQMSPYVSLVAGMFSASRMTRHNEVVAALNAGVSLRRLYAPILLGATVLALGMFGLREWASEEIGAKRRALEDYLTERRPHPVYENFRVFDRRGRPLSISSYESLGVGGGEPRIVGLSGRYDEGEYSIIITAPEARYAGDGLWSLENGRRTVVDDDKWEKEELDVLEDNRFTPEDIESAWKGHANPMELSFREARSLLQRDPSNQQFRTLLHYHITFPLAGVILLIVGLPFVLAQSRGRGTEKVAKGFFICVAYFGLEFVTRTLGLQGQIGPLFAAWLPVLGFGALGVVLFGSMRT